MTILSSLKKLLKKMGGTSTAEANTISEVIGEITSAYQNGGGGGGGSDNNLVIHLDAENVMDKTWTEIKNAIDAGGYVAVHYYYEDPDMTCVKAVNIYSINESLDEPYLLEDSDDSFSTDSPNGYPKLQDII